MGQSKYPYIEFSGALQQATTPHIRKANEVIGAENVTFSKLIGAFVRRPGSQKYNASDYPTIPTSPIDKNTLGAFIARYPTGAEIWMASNVSDDSTANVRRWTGSSWVDVNTGQLPNAEYNFMYDLEEVWVSSYNRATDTLGTPFTVDSAHDVSLIRQLQFAPAARFFIEFNGSNWAANVQVGANRYRDRLYKSSGPTGVIASARSAQTDVAAAVTLVDQVPTMTSNSAPVGTVTASTQYDASHQGWMAFNDEITSAAWLTSSGTTTGTLQYDFGSGVTKTIVYYSLIGVPSGDNVPNRAPKTWTFEGSNNGSSWTTIDTQTNVSAWVADEKRTYTTTNTTAYRYYRINVSANQGDATFLSVAEMELLVSTSGVQALTVNVDSVRYIKPTQNLDVYAAGTNTKKFDITVLDVDKINDAFTFIPYQLNFATTDVNTSTEVITLSSAANFPTGTTIRFYSTSGLPAPLAAGTTYYAIFVSSTTIKVATSLTNAQTGVAINLTTTGTGTHTIFLSYVIANRDEFWGDNRKGKLTRYWNTDYRNPENSDWLKLPATLDATNDITAVGKLSSRMFIWTLNAMFKTDGSNLTTLYNDVGCASQRSVAYYQSFMIWLDARGQIWIRNEEAGTQDVISQPIEKTLALVSQDSLLTASAVCVGKKYKLTIGQVTVGERTHTLRVVYDLQNSQWSTEWFTEQMPVQLEYKYSGTIRPHFFDEHGAMYVDELGDDDSGQTIQTDVTLGDDNLQVDEDKSWVGLKIYGRNCVGTKVLVSIDYGDWNEIGELRKNIDKIAVPKVVPKGTMINLRFTNSSSGDAPEIHKALVYFNIEEDTFRVAK